MSRRLDAIGCEQLTLLPTLAITGAINPAVVTAPIAIGNAWYLAVEVQFVYGSGGTTVDVYVQTSLDGGLTWFDVANIHLTTASATVASAVVATTALAANATLVDGALTNNTILSGILGDRIRLKYKSAGTYAGGTTLSVFTQTKA